MNYLALAWIISKCRNFHALSAIAIFTYLHMHTHTHLLFATLATVWGVYVTRFWVQISVLLPFYAKKVHLKMRFMSISFISHVYFTHTTTRIHQYICGCKYAARCTRKPYLWIFYEYLFATHASTGTLFVFVLLYLLFTYFRLIGGGKEFLCAADVSHSAYIPYLIVSVNLCCTFCSTLPFVCSYTCSNTFICMYMCVIFCSSSGDLIDKWQYTVVVH